MNIASVTIPPLTTAQISSISNSGTYLYNSVTSPKYTITNTNGGYPWTTISASSPSMHVKGDAEFDGNIKWKTRDLGKLLENIENRLAILVPNPAKLEKYEALRKAYDHYILLEKLIGED